MEAYVEEMHRHDSEVTTFKLLVARLERFKVLQAKLERDMEKIVPHMQRAKELQEEMKW